MFSIKQIKVFYLIYISKVTIILITNQKNFFLKMSTSKDIAITDSKEVQIEAKFMPKKMTGFECQF